jgi:hypothetical protein
MLSNPYPLTPYPLFSNPYPLNQYPLILLHTHIYAYIHMKIGTIQFLEVGKEIVKTRGFGGLYAGFKFKSLHLGGGTMMMMFTYTR